MNSLEKIALNLKAARAASHALKKRTVKRALVPNYDKGTFIGNRRAPGGGAFTPSVLSEKTYMGQLPGLYRANLDDMREGVAPLVGVAKQHSPSGKVIFMGRGGGGRAIQQAAQDTSSIYGGIGDMNPLFRIAKKYKRMGGRNKEMVNRVSYLHEGAEASIRPRSVLQVGSHYSPEVLLKEHNMIRTLPKKYSGTKNFYRELRGAVHESDMLSSGYPRFRYGESPRLSRHAIKRMMQGYRREADRNIMPGAKEMLRQHFESTRL